MTTDRHEGDLHSAWEDPILAPLLSELRDIADEPAPAIGPDLSAVLGGAAPLAPNRARRGKTVSAVVISLVSTGVLAGGISAAAADELPAPVQRVVARVVNTITPFEMPERDGGQPIERAPHDEAPTTQVPVDVDDDEITLPRDTDTSQTPGADTSDTSSGDDGDDRSDDGDDRDEVGSSGSSDGTGSGERGDSEEAEEAEDAEEAEEADGSDDSDGSDGFDASDDSSGSSGSGESSGSSGSSDGGSDADQRGDMEDSGNSEDPEDPEAPEDQADPSDSEDPGDADN